MTRRPFTVTSSAFHSPTGLERWLLADPRVARVESRRGVATLTVLLLALQDGHGARLLGLAGPLDGVFPIVPALVFCTVFGLSMEPACVLVL